MQLLVLTSTRHAIFTLQTLHQRGILRAVVCPDRRSEDVSFLHDWAEAQNLPFFYCTQQTISTVLADLLAGIDAAIVFGFPWKIPARVLNAKPAAFFNVHFSLLPAYRGPMPVFWQIKNGAVLTGVTIHSIDTQFDTGAIVSSVSVPAIPGETEGLCSSRLGQLSVKLVDELVDNLAAGTITLSEQPADGVSYHNRPADNEISIDWSTQRAEEVQRLTDACNPLFMGAKTFLKGMAVRIVEVSPTDASDQSGALPGTIVHADMGAGLFVVCADKKIIRVNTIYTPDGIFTGSKMVALGARAGDRFYTSESVKEKVMA